jgi:hypothetical protein
MALSVGDVVAGDHSPEDGIIATGLALPMPMKSA